MRKLHQQHRAMLRALRDAGGVALWQQLAAHYNVLRAMEDGGYVSGATTGAGYMVSLTDKGREALEER